MDILTGQLDKSLKQLQVKQMFDGIAGRYDMLNHLLSFGIDRYWRRMAVNELKSFMPHNILDIATGTGDLAIETAKNMSPAKIHAVDISKRMLEVAKHKINQQHLENSISLKCANALDLPFEDNTFDAVTVAFGIRNFTSVQKGISEMRRVLKPKGHLCILEFSEPEYSIIKKTYNFYFSKVLPKVGNRIAQHNFAYDYLQKSVVDFPSGQAFIQLLLEEGLINTIHKPLTFGIVSLYLAEK